MYDNHLEMLDENADAQVPTPAVLILYISWDAEKFVTEMPF